MDGTPLTPSVWAVVVNWDRRDDTVQCLESLASQTYPRLSILVVDNGSKDGIAAGVERRFPGVRVLTLLENRGFAGGSNAGIRQALEWGADLVFLVNNDTRADPSMLAELVRALRPGTAVVAPKIYFWDDPRRIWSVGGKRHPLILEMTDIGTGQPDHGQWESVVERDYLTGCALLIRRDVFDRVGLLDERFHSYYEDLDFCARVRDAGLRLLMAPGARLWHKVAQSSGGSDSPRERYAMARGSVLFFRLHVRGWRWCFVIPYRLASAAKTSVRLLLVGRPSSVSAYWRGLLDGWRFRLQQDGQARDTGN